MIDVLLQWQDGRIEIRHSIARAQKLIRFENKPASEVSSPEGSSIAAQLRRSLAHLNVTEFDRVSLIAPESNQKILTYALWLYREKPNYHTWSIEKLTRHYELFERDFQAKAEEAMKLQAILKQKRAA